MKTHLLALASALVLSQAAAQAPAQPTVVSGTIVADSQITPNSSSGVKETIPVYAYYRDENSPNPFTFNFHYSQMPVKWTLELPDELEGAGYSITSATVIAYQAPVTAVWQPEDFQIKLFKTGFESSRPENVANWTEANGYYGPGAATTTPLQNPYLSELGTGAHAENVSTATAWSLGIVGPGYDGTSSPTDAVPVTFPLDVNNAEIEAYLREGLNNGAIMFTIVSSFPGIMPGGGGGTPTDYPKFISREGALKDSLGASRSATRLLIEVTPESSVADWEIY